MKVLFLTMFLATVIAHPAKSQKKYFSKAARISFYSKTPLAAIEAHNSKAVSVFDLSSGRIEFSVLMKGFEFEKARMQEDFNENFVESDKYPKAVFAGTMKSANDLNFDKDGVYNVEVTGSLTIHGVTKPVTTQAAFTVKNGVVSAQSEFTVTVADYNIKIPSVVSEKIGKTAKIIVNVPSYQPLADKS